MLDLRELAIEFLDQLLGFLPAEEFGPSSRTAINQRFPSDDVSITHAEFVKPGVASITVGCNPTSEHTIASLDVPRPPLRFALRPRPLSVTLFLQSAVLRNRDT